MGWGKVAFFGTIIGSTIIGAKRYNSGAKETAKAGYEQGYKEGTEAKGDASKEDKLVRDCIKGLFR